MGKAKKYRHHAGKVNPLGTINADEELNSSNGVVQSILNQLEAVSADEKMCGLQSLSTFCQNGQNIPAILDSEIIRIVSPLLVDKTTGVRHATAGALRNLSALNVEICELMVEQDVLTPLLALLNQYAAKADWKPVFGKNFDNQLDQTSDIFLQAINLVWNLCESTSTALESFNQSQLLTSLIRCLNWRDFGMDISIAVAQCLLVISEDNPTAWKMLMNYRDEFVALLELDGDHANVMLRTVAAGVMANVPALLTPNMSHILLALSKTLDCNHRSVLNNLTSSLPLIKEERNHEIEVHDDGEMETESEASSTMRRRKADMPTLIEIEIKNCGWLLQAQRIAAEVFSNLCSAEDEEWQDEMDDGNISDAESVQDYDMAGSESVPNNDKLPVELLEALKSLGVIEKLLQRSLPLPENVTLILKDCEKGLLKRVTSLRVSAMLCLQNICNCLSTEDLGGPESIYNVWLDLGQQVFQGQDDKNILESSTALMRATLAHLRKNPELFKQMTETDLQLMLKGVQDCQEPEIRANWIRMLGILGCLLTERLVKLITAFIVEVCQQETDAWALSEAIDSLMDIFSDNDWNQIVYELGLAAKSRELEKILKTKIRQQKRELKDRYPTCSTVRTNLTRFCKYLEDQMRTFTPNTEI